ncbi:MAG: thiamine phosphate synthase [Candidatus Acidiferrales bacterium]
MVLCYVTDRHLTDSDSPAADLLACIERAAAAGIDWIQIREKGIEARELLELARRGITAVKNRPGTPARVLVNDRLDVALAAGAAGVHLGGTSVPVAEVVRWRREENAASDFLIGVSCHRLDEAMEAEKAGASYIFFGPIFETPSKIVFGAPQGMEKLREVCSSVRIPVLAIGGITEENAGACFRAGAQGIAAIRMFQQAPDRATLLERVAHLRALS